MVIDWSNILCFVILDLALDWEMHNDYYLAVHFVAILLAYYHQGCKRYIV